jgi:RNA polymerase sigma-70 factor (ECF subfamily)
LRFFFFDHEKTNCNRPVASLVLPEWRTLLSPFDDLADVEAVLNGDISRFEGIVKRWQGPLVNLAYRFCRDRSRAEDMAQEAFLRTFRSLRQWRREGAFSTWLFALATNVYRTELGRIPAAIALDDIAEPSDSHIFTEQVEQEQRDELVRRAVAVLPPRYRDVLTLFYFHDMNVTLAAASLGLPEGTIKARLLRARDILRSKLQPRLAASAVGVVHERR